MSSINKVATSSIRKLPFSRGLSTKTHYSEHTSTSYESAYFYSPGKYAAFLCEAVRDTLKIQNSSDNRRRLLDIGGGTGNFTKQILDGVSGMDAVVIDPFLPPSSGADDLNNIRFVKAGAEDFIEPQGTSIEDPPWWKTSFHQCLFKEVVHHISVADRKEVFRGIYAGLLPCPEVDLPSVLIITRPQYDIDYPLWPEARDVWARNQPSVDEIKIELGHAGFQKVAHCVKAYKCEMELDRWCQMVKGRFWSTFSNFSDDELGKACQIIEENASYDKDRIIQFEDRLVFITAHK